MPPKDQQVACCARFSLTQVFCGVGAGGSEKKLAAKATAARKLHYTAGMACIVGTLFVNLPVVTLFVKLSFVVGGSFGQPHLYNQSTILVQGHQLLLHTVLAQSYPPFALLPLLQRGQKLSPAAIWPGANTVRRQHHIKSPCFAAKPLYANIPRQNSSRFSVRWQTPAPLKILDIEAQKAIPESHPLCKYAALGRVQHIQSVPVAAASRSTLTSLHTYARLAQPVLASNHAAASNQQSRQTLRRYAQLHSKLPKHNNAQLVSANRATHTNALKSYAQLGCRS